MGRFSLLALPAASHSYLQFNIETELVLSMREHVKLYGALSKMEHTPVYRIQVFVEVPRLSYRDGLAYVGTPKTLIDPLPSTILVEEWTIEHVRWGATKELRDGAPGLYKDGISICRSIYSLLRSLPAWKIDARLTEMSGDASKFQFKTSVGVNSDKRPPLGVLHHGRRRSTPPYNVI